VGGTFDRLHRGHQALLEAAFRAAAEVRLGLTTSRYLAEHPKEGADRLRPYAARRRNLARYLRSTFPRRRWQIVPLDDALGGGVEPGIDVLIASEETRSGAHKVNVARRRRGLPALRLVLIPVELADDRRPISSTRIRAGEIDARGRLRRTRPKD
jgi:cytidyltransferase-like protein